MERDPGASAGPLMGSRGGAASTDRPTPTPRATSPSGGALHVVAVAAVVALLLAAYAIAAPRLRRGTGARGPASASARPEASTPPPTALAADRGAPPPPPAHAAGRAPQRVLIFGDSMVAVLAPRLAEIARENGHAVFPVVWYGSTILRWARVDELDRLIAETQPTIVVAVLGSSELTVREIEECEPFVGLLARKAAPRELAWIGPPNWRVDTGVNAMIERALGDRRFFRSSGLDLERGVDGIHPTARGGAAWADAFARWAELRSPLGTSPSAPARAAPAVPLRVVSRRP